MPKQYAIKYELDVGGVKFYHDDDASSEEEALKRFREEKPACLYRVTDVKTLGCDEALEPIDGEADQSACDRSA